MKYCILLTGKNSTMINEFFIHLIDDFDCLSASSRYEDLMNHLKQFSPDAIVYCVSQESINELRQLTMLKDMLDMKHVPLIVIGSSNDCDDFNKATFGMADFNIEKPISIKGISTRLNGYLDSLEEEREARRIAEEERAEELRRREEAKLARIEQHAQKIESLTGKKPEGAIDKELENLMSEMGISVEEAETKTAERKRILIIDDDPLMLKSIKEQLHQDYDVATAINGKVALKFLSSKHPDLILLDYEMPFENGPEVLKEIQSNEKTSDIPVIFLTGVMERGKIEQVLALKPQGYLLKPVDHAKLLETISQFL